MISESILNNLTPSDLSLQRNRFEKRNNEIRKMNQYLSSENREMEEKNESLKKMAERLIKISNDIVIPKNTKEKNQISQKFHNIFSPLKEKIKVESEHFSDIIDNNKRAIFRNLQKTKETFNVLKENFNERIINKQNNINKPEKKRIFDNSTFPRKSFDINDENFPSDVTNKNSCKYIEEIKFETQSIEKPENMKEEKEGTLENEEKVTIELSEIEKNEI